mmetsp:Transcript_10728/g.26967  ORF Transcript_10728/g.26967 Transcript_10728/m.26967 type:complete len:251 (-) Transcript_10728:703-1455(-)
MLERRKLLQFLPLCLITILHHVVIKLDVGEAEAEGARLDPQRSAPLQPEPPQPFDHDVTLSAGLHAHHLFDVRNRPYRIYELVVRIVTWNESKNLPVLNALFHHRPITWLEDVELHFCGWVEAGTVDGEHGNPVGLLGNEILSERGQARARAPIRVRGRGTAATPAGNRAHVSDQVLSIFVVGFTVLSSFFLVVVPMAVLEALPLLLRLGHEPLGNEEPPLAPRHVLVPVLAQHGPHKADEVKLLLAKAH